MDGMGPEEYRAAIASLGQSVIGAARCFGVNERTGRRWAVEDGPSQPVARTVRYLLASGISLAEFELVATQGRLARP